GRPTVYLEGLSYSELPVAKKREEVPLGSTFEWKKDISMVDSVSEIESETTTTTTTSSNTPDAAKELRGVIGLLGFKTPDAKVIEIGSGATGVTRIALEALHPARRKRLYNSYTYVCTSEEQLEETTAAVDALEKEDVSVVDLEQLSLCHTPDIVVMSLSTLLSDDDGYLQDDLTELKTMQTAGSRLIVYSNHHDDGCVGASIDDDHDYDDDTVAKRLQSLGYTLHSKTKSGLILAEPVKRVSLEQDTNITILARSTPEGRAVAEEVRSYFEARGFKTHIYSSQVVPSDGSLVISLLDLTDGTNTVFDLEPRTFRPFMDSLCGLRGSLVWVMPSVHGDDGCKDARPAMIQGTARTVRMENKADITLVEADDLPATRAGLPGALFKICQSLPNRRRGGDLDADYDYAVVDGSVHIPRMYWFGLSDPDVVGEEALPASRESETLPGPASRETHQTPMFRGDDASYLLVGGFGGLGRAVATWLLEHGARNLVFLSRSAGAANPDNAAFVRELESYPGCVVTCVSGDVGNADDVRKAIAAAPKPVAGVLQLSLVLRDNSTAEMTWDEWDGVVNPRVRGTWNLHRALLDAQVPLDFFVIFGSGGGHTGYYGQANYSASNTYLDAFVEYRHHLGLPASIIDLGVVGDVGYLLERDDLYDSFKNGGFFFLGEQDVLDAAAVAVAHSAGGPYSSFCLGGLSEKPLSDPTNRVNWKRDVRFAQSHHFSKSHKGEAVG
ncbi:Lovastatin diketide synthase LovF, partial [Colletotrichum tanaceti]